MKSDEVNFDKNEQKNQKNRKIGKTKNKIILRKTKNEIGNLARNRKTKSQIFASIKHEIIISESMERETLQTHVFPR